MLGRVGDRQKLNVPLSSIVFQKCSVVYCYTLLFNVTVAFDFVVQVSLVAAMAHVVPVLP